MTALNVVLDPQVNMSCNHLSINCEFDPPPSIIEVPPPPLPNFLKEVVHYVVDENENNSCRMCKWAGGAGVELVEVPRKGPMLDDTWFFVIISCCIGAVLISVILLVAYLRYRAQKIKDGALGIDKRTPAEYCEAVLFPGRRPEVIPENSRALWAGIKAQENNQFTLTHVQPVDQKIGGPGDFLNSLASLDYDYADYSDLQYHPPLPTMPPPSLPGGSFENTGFVDSDSLRVLSESVLVSRSKSGKISSTLIKRADPVCSRIPQPYETFRMKPVKGHSSTLPQYCHIGTPPPPYRPPPPPVSMTGHYGDSSQYCEPVGTVKSKPRRKGHFAHGNGTSTGFI